LFRDVCDPHREKRIFKSVYYCVNLGLDGRLTFKWILNKLKEYGVALFVSGNKSFSLCCELDNETLCTIKCGAFLDSVKTG
jgi:hypothetical protein